MDRLSTVHHDNEGTLAAKEVDEQLQEGVDCESLKGSQSVSSQTSPGHAPASYLVDIPNRIEVERRFQ